MGTRTASDESAASDDPYVVRQYEVSDRDGVLDLDEAVWGRQRSPEWFAWKYEHNPYLSEIPVHVATLGGAVVGARPLMAFRLSVDGAELLALQPSDTMVHPDHRGNGLFTRMTQRAISAHTDGEPALFFNFPNQQVQPGYQKLGWRVAGARTTHYRIQNPESLLPAGGGTRVGRSLARVAVPALAGYNRLHDLRARSTADVSVEDTRSVPAGLLASLYRRRVPDRLHAVRDEQFYRWRLASPAWARRTYVAVRGDDPVAALVARTRTNADGITVTQVADVVPLDGGQQWLRSVGPLFDRLLSDHQDSDLVAVAGSPLPHSFLRRRAFHRNDQLPLSRLKSHHRILAVRPLRDGPEPWRVNGRSLTEKANWLVTFAERDTA